jgi:uncharacterized protein DUF6789
MTLKGWIARSIVAGSAGTLVHFLFMYFKSRFGLLPAFQPYHSFQIALSRWTGSDVPAIVPWLLSFLNGMALIGLLFGRIFQRLPGRGGAAKGLSFGVIGWLLLNLAFFPLIDLGPFAIRVGAGIGPALLSLGMLLTYSIVLGIVYVALDHGFKNHPQATARRLDKEF